MNRKWTNYTLPDQLSVEEARQWCEENCHGRFSIRISKRKLVLSYYSWKPPRIKFQFEVDAMAFKLRWI